MLVTVKVFVLVLLVIWNAVNYEYVKKVKLKLRHHNLQVGTLTAPPKRGMLVL